MTLFERIEDWLTGGNYSDLIRISRAATSEMVNQNSRANRFHEALQAIADQETPGANATVKRMAKIAKEGMKDGK